MSDEGTADDDGDEHGECDDDDTDGNDDDIDGNDDDNDERDDGDDDDNNDAGERYADERDCDERWPQVFQVAQAQNLVISQRYFNKNVALNSLGGSSTTFDHFPKIGAINVSWLGWSRLEVELVGYGR